MDNSYFTTIAQQICVIQPKFFHIVTRKELAVNMVVMLDVTFILNIIMLDERKGSSIELCQWQLFLSPCNSPKGCCCACY